MGVSASISAKLQEDAKPAPVERHSPRAESKVRIFLYIFQNVTYLVSCFYVEHATTSRT